jgi:hypothetical protein
LLNVRLDDILVYSSDRSTEISHCPERFLFSPVELPEVSFESFFSEYLVGTSSFEKLDNMRDWMNQRNTQVYMNMIFFHSYGYWSDIEFFANSLEYFLYFFLEWLCKTFSSILCYPNYVISAVIDCM